MDNAVAGHTKLLLSASHRQQNQLLLPHRQIVPTEVEEIVGALQQIPGNALR